jgi:hypothetical protein
MASDHEISQREAQVVNLLHEAARQERAPDSLRTRVEAQRAGARSRPKTQRAGVFGLPARYVGGAAGGTVFGGIVAALVLILSGGGGGVLSIADAATLATRGAQQPAPKAAPGSPGLLTARVGDLQFPNWIRDGGWHSAGERVDRTGGRRTVTVYYARPGQSIAYSIVSAPVLAGLTTHGERYATILKNGRTTIVWQERNHTCLLSGHGIPAATLWSLAATKTA